MAVHQFQLPLLRKSPRITDHNILQLCDNRVTNLSANAIWAIDIGILYMLPQWKANSIFKYWPDLKISNNQDDQSNTEIMYQGKENFSVYLENNHNNWKMWITMEAVILWNQTMPGSLFTGWAELSFVPSTCSSSLNISSPFTKLQSDTVLWFL